MKIGRFPFWFRTRIDWQARQIGNIEYCIPDDLVSEADILSLEGPRKLRA
jgi:hypothetical protein